MSNSSTSVAVVISDNDGLCVITPFKKEVYHKNAKKFFADIPKIFKNVKAVTLNVFGYEPNESDGFKSNLSFCKAVKEKLDSLGILYYFCFQQHHIGSILLFTAKVNVQFHETVLLVIDFIEYLLVTEYEYTQGGYKIVSEKDYSIDLKENPQVIREKICASSNPTKIILATGRNRNPRMKTLKTALKSKKLIVVDHPMPESKADYLFEASKWMSDRSYTKYHVIPTCGRRYILSAMIDEAMIPFIIMDPVKDFLPCTKTVFIPGCFDNFIVIRKVRAEDCKEFTGVKILQKFHQTKVTFTVDVEHFLDVKYEAIFYDKIEDLPETLDSSEILNISKIPVIGIMNGFSVICVNKNDDGYDYLDSWNGFYGKEHAISFDEEKPKYSIDAFRVLSEKPTYVVYDILKIMSQPPDNVEINEMWKFAVTNDENNPLLLEFDNYDGTKKFSTPAFLMALLLKQHLKAIKEEMGEKPTEIGICILDEFNEDERKRVEEGLKEACELLKIGCQIIAV